MKLTINARQLKDTLTAVKPFVPSKPNPAICGHVLIQSDIQNGTHITAYDGKAGTAARFPVESSPRRIMQPGSCTVKFAELHSLSRSAKGEVTLQYDGESLIARFGQSAFTLTFAKPASDFPELPSAWYGQLTGTSFRTSYGQFSQAVKYAQSATDRTERNYRNTVLFDMKADYQCIVGTDAKRLNYSDIQGVMCFDVSDGKPCEFEALINADVAKRIAGVKADYSAQCDFGIRHVTSDSGTHTDYFAWVIDQCEGFCRLVDTPYPAWTEVIAGNYHGALEVKADELCKAVNQLKPILKARDSMDIVKLSGNGTLYVSASAESEGSGRIWLNTNHTDGPDLLVGLNYKFLQAVLKSHKGHTVTIKYGSELSPVAVSAGADCSQSAILMPVKLPEN